MAWGDGGIITRMNDMFDDWIRMVMGEEWFLLVVFSGDGLTFDCGFEWRVRGTAENLMIPFLWVSSWWVVVWIETSFWGFGWIWCEVGCLLTKVAGTRT